MAKVKTQYACQSCGYVTSKWLGRCPSCDTWNSLVEERSASDEEVRRSSREPGVKPDWVLLDDTQSETKPQRRLSTGIGELDRVLGGGLVPDSFVLLGGEPGIGKSTLLLQMVQGLLREHPKLRILYATGEESIDQIRGRAHRLGVRGADRAFLAADTLLESVFATVKEVKPDVLLVDSLQTFASSQLESAPGSVGQVREITSQLMKLAKSEGISVWLVGHVTKEGSIAGPKAVEHMVDTVLYFETESGQSYRLLRAVKNRFGSSRELGVFEMDGEGLREVGNPSSLFLSDRKEPVAGTAISATLEGSRPLLVELQALVATTSLAMPRRTSVGIDSSRIALIAAILEKHMKMSLATEDLFFNVAGGLKLNEPACDLAAAAAIWSSYEERSLPAGWVFIGEVGLTGEVRRVSQIDVRVEEARKLGFSTLVIPRSSQDRAKSLLGKNVSKIELISLASVTELPGLLK